MTTLAVTSVSSLLCPRFPLLSHRLEVPLHSINANRDAVDERERLRMFREHGSEVPPDDKTEECDTLTSRLKSVDSSGKSVIQT